MNVLILSTSERGIAPYRLYKALQNNSVTVRMLVRDKLSDNPDVLTVNTSRLKCMINRMRFTWERLAIWFLNGFSRKNLFKVSLANTGTDISDLEVVRNADIIHLHWTNQGFLSLKDIGKLVKSGKPLVWTMHDMWASTGICHYAGECERFQVECGNCFLLRFPFKKDISYWVLKQKSRLPYEKITFVTCSNWLKHRTEKSHLFRSSRIISIPNPLDLNIFTPLDKTNARHTLSLAVEKYYLLFGAAKVNDPRKGFEYFLQALELLFKQYPELSHKLEVVFLGKSDFEAPSPISFCKIHYTGFITDEKTIANWYGAVDLFIIPSLEDNLPNTIMESMACGTPVVGFDTGGIPEMIDHRKNGYVARYKDSEDLMHGIYWSLFETDYYALSRNAREKVKNSYSEENVAGMYVDLYKSLLGK